MPEGHSVHRIALQLAADLVGHQVTASSPQGRFAAGAALLDGTTMTRTLAVGKQLLVELGDRWLRVHLGLYGAWDFHGRVSSIGAGGTAAGSIGAPRLRGRVSVRIGEVERESVAVFPPDPVGQVRLRLATAETVADLRGPSACEVLTPDDVAALLARAGPDPRVDAWPDPEGTLLERLTSRGSPVGQLLMDQSVISGIGNVYRAEMLFRARLDPWTPGRRVPADVVRGLWLDWVGLLDDGVRTGVMVTREDLDGAGRAAAIADRSQRHAVYGRAGQPCLVCGGPVRLEDMAGRKLYWCPTCQR